MDRSQSCIDIIEVYFALGLEFVDIIEEMKCECSAWLFQRCGKPSHSKELDTGRLLCSGIPTIAVIDSNSHDASNVEEDEINGGGRQWTAVTNTMAKLIRGTKLEERGPGKKLTCPF